MIFNLILLLLLLCTACPFYEYKLDRVFANSEFQRCTNSAGIDIILTEENTNDDYCDCDVDGLDEKFTSACSFLDNSQFSCPDLSGVINFIPSSFVNDGVCVFFGFYLGL